MGAFDFKADPAPTADDYFPAERVTSNIVIRARQKPEDMKVRGASGTSYALSSIADAAEAANGGNTTNNAANVGAIAAQPAAGTVACTIRTSGKFFTLDFVLTAARLAVTDAGASGASGSLKLFDFVQGGVLALGCRQDYTAFAEGAALTGAAGDAAFVMGLGSVAANAGDGVLTATEVDFGAVTDAITLSGGTGVGGKFSASAAILDGTATAVDLYLNWCGTAATIDANSTIDVTGTISITGCMMGDD